MVIFFLKYLEGKIELNIFPGNKWLYISLIVGSIQNDRNRRGGRQLNGETGRGTNNFKEATQAFSN